MPIAQKFKALGAGNGFPSVYNINGCVETSTPNGYDLCPESFTLAEIMEWFWNSEDYVGGSFTYNLVNVDDGTYARRFEVHFDPDGFSGTDSDIGLQIAKDPDDDDGQATPTRDMEPKERVCRGYGIEMHYNVFRALGSGGSFSYLDRRTLYMEIIKNGEDDYQIAVNAPDGTHTGTKTYVESIRTPDDEETFSLPMPNSKSLSIPWATSHSSDSADKQMFFGTVTNPSSLEFYTYT
jgi:hypothetical protein